MQYIQHATQRAARRAEQTMPGVAEQLCSGADTINKLGADSCAHVRLMQQPADPQTDWNANDRGQALCVNSQGGQS